MILEYGRDQIVELAISAHKQYKVELDRTLILPEFVQDLIENAKKGDKKFNGWNTMMDVEYPRTIKIAPSVKEMVDSLAEIDDKLKLLDNSDLNLKDQFEQRKALIRGVIQPKKIIEIKERPDIWWGDTLKGINMRPGLVNNDKTKCYPFQVGGTRSHLFAVGDTGQGKSVLMNALILGLLIEYPPWELNLLMNDGKMQEYAIYAGAYKCPQIRNIAITMSSTYYASVYDYYQNEMQLLNRLYAMTKVKSLSALRDYLDLSIPSQIIPHDEYAQFQINATSKEWMKQTKYMSSIAMLGRSTRYHLFPTSQNLSGELEKKTANQFQIGIAVGTDEDNSEYTIGNNKAKELLSNVGYCVVNTNRKQGSVEENLMYKVPFLDDKTDEDKMKFQRILKIITDTAESLDITDKPSVYNEMSQSLITVFYKHLTKIKELESNKNQRSEEHTLALMTLGDGVRYTGEEEVIEYFKWNYERNSNIFIHAIAVEQIKYLARAVGNNLREQDVEVKNFMFVDNIELFETNYVEDYSRDLTSDLDILPRLNQVELRDLIIKYNLVMSELGEEPDFKGYVEFVVSKGKEPELKNILDKYSDVNSYDYDRLALILDKAEDTTLETQGEYKDIYEWAESNIKGLIVLFRQWDTYEYMMGYRKGKYLIPTDLPIMLHWFLEPQLNEGLNSRAGTSADFLKFLNVGPSVGVFSIVMMQEVKEQKPIIQCCKHLLTGEPSSAMERFNLVEFTDLTGIVCKYTVCEGDGTQDRYFKRYLEV